ncbi:MAG: RNase J family beta-CASP ribonuclease [Euryarchaeota archaeon]|nr:RNase J family beta-CASP ribonuclease [Euryarchaeota archaeon]
MEVEVMAVGGYGEMGRNMTAVRVGNEAVIIDMGIRLDRITIHEDMVFEDTNSPVLVKLGAIPNDEPVKKLNAKVKAILLSHGHLDHIGAISKLADKYRCPIYAAPFAAALAEDEVTTRGGRRLIRNPIHKVEPGKIIELSKNIRIEFVHVTHSICDATMPVIHTARGAVVYASDFKLDNNPVIGPKSDYDRMHELAIEGVLALIVESTNAGDDTKTPSETIARDLLKDFLFGVDNGDSGIIVSTFSSHTARMKSISEFAERLDREVMFVGRSMEKYVNLSVQGKHLHLPRRARIIGDAHSINKALGDVMRKGPEKYLIVATGHQGEPNSLMSRIADEETPYRVGKKTQVIFSANVIPNPVNVANRHVLETKLKIQGARITRGAHVSGHGSREDHRELLRMLEPQHVIPNHGTVIMQAHYVEMAEDFGYELGRNLHFIRNGQKVTLGRP